MNNIMIDIETLGIKPGSIVLSIGAVEFSATELGQKFNMHIDSIDAAAHGLTIDASTVKWWFAQNPAAIAAISDAVKHPMAHVVEAFARAFPKIAKQRVWCNGASFDFPILTAMYAAVGVKTPWAYYNEMDMRTVKGLVGKSVWDAHKAQPTTAHDGLADAIAQAQSLQAVLKYVGHSDWLK